jgi:SIR2-like domain
LPIFITTNYDTFLQRALAATGTHVPRVEICRWKGELLKEIPRYASAKPTSREPLVFHLHGHTDTEASILVTEDDYIDFTVSLAHRTDKDPVIPHWIRRALSWTTLLFIGYSLEDWNFRVLMRHLMKQQQVLRSEQAFSLSIQLSDSGIDAERRARAERFLADYLGTSAIRVHWGPAGPFLAELDERVQAAREKEAHHG